MKILFIFPHIHPYNSQSVREKPSGGTEKVVCFLSEALTKLGHECKIATSLNEFPDVDINWPDAVITQESQLFFQFPKAKKIWWVHHFIDQEIIARGAVWARLYADHIVTLSQCQSDEFQDELRLASTIIPHGVWLDELHPPTAKDPYRLIYASTPFRGLEKIPALFSQIKAREPRATIAICSSMATYGKPEEDAKYADLFSELKRMDGVDVLGSLNQQQLYAEYAKASTFFYPCIWRETYCLALDEAIAHGCFPVVPGLGALMERAAITEAEEFAEDVLSSFEHGNWAPGKEPRDWMEVARQWEREVLSVPV